MDKILYVILLIIVVLVLTIYIYYQMLDRKKFMAAAHFVNALDEPLGEWLSEAISDGNRPPAADDHLQRLQECLEKFDDTKPVRFEQKTLLLNEAHGLLKRICIAAADDSQMEDWRNRLNQRVEEVLDPMNQFNHYVRAYNKKLETRTGAVVADLLHLKHLTVLKDLRL